MTFTGTGPVSWPSDRSGGVRPVPRIGTAHPDCSRAGRLVGFCPDRGAAAVLHQGLQVPVVLLAARRREMGEHGLAAEGELALDLHLVPLDLHDVVARPGVSAEPKRGRGAGVRD